MTESINAETFKPYVGKPASLSDGHKLTLAAVHPHKSRAPDASRGEAFSLLLSGAPSPVAPEGMHRLTFEDGAGFDLYLIPIHTPSRDRQDYQIVFG